MAAPSGPIAPRGIDRRAIPRAPPPPAEALGLMAAARPIEVARLQGRRGLDGPCLTLDVLQTHRVLTIMAKYGGIGPQSVLLDLGSGLGEFLLHAAVASGARCMGVELDALAHVKAVMLKDRHAEHLCANGMPEHAAAVRRIMLKNDAIERVRAAPTCTHLYAFWSGFHASTKRHVARLWNEGAMQCIAIVHESADIVCDMLALGFRGVRRACAHTWLCVEGAPHRLDVFVRAI